MHPRSLPAQEVGQGLVHPPASAGAGPGPGDSRRPGGDRSRLAPSCRQASFPCRQAGHQDRGEEEGEDNEAEKDDEKESKVDDLTIDFDSLSDRVEALPLSRGNYRSLAVNDGAVFYLNAEDGDFNRFE